MSQPIIFFLLTKILYLVYKIYHTSRWKKIKRLRSYVADYPPPPTPTRPLIHNSLYDGCVELCVCVALRVFQRGHRRVVIGLREGGTSRGFGIYKLPCDSVKWTLPAGRWTREAWGGGRGVCVGGGRGNWRQNWGLGVLVSPLCAEDTVSTFLDTTLCSWEVLS